MALETPDTFAADWQIFAVFWRAIPSPINTPFITRHHQHHARLYVGLRDLLATHGGRIRPVSIPCNLAHWNPMPSDHAA
jgi:hypothetical protein